MLKKENRSYQSELDVATLEVFALTLDYRLKKLPFFDRRYNHTKISVTDEGVVLYEIFFTKKKSLKYYLVFSNVGIIPGKDWIITRGKKSMNFLVVLSRGIHLYEKRLMEEILYREVVQWLHGEKVEKRVYLLIKKHIEENYLGVLFMNKMNTRKDMIFRYDVEVGITNPGEKFFDTSIKIDVKSSLFALKKMKEGGKHKINPKVHIMLAENNDSDAGIIEKFEVILHSHMKGYRKVS